MIKKIVYFSLLHAFVGITLGLSSCMSTKNVQSTVPEDDVYYSNARAKEIVLAQQAVREEQPINDYVTDEELYGDTYSNYGYSDYTSRINRFRGYHPSLSYYNSIYGYNYDPFFSPSFFPYSYFGSPGINLGIGINSGFYSYNPWRFQGLYYGSNFWGPYSYFNPYNSFGVGFGGGNFNGGNFNRGYYSGIYSSPAFTAPNYRARPTRASDNTPMERGAVIGVPGSIIRDNSGNIIQSRGRAERYGAQPGNGGSTTRTQPETRPARVNQTPPQRPSQPERIYTAPRQDNGSGSRSSQPSNNNGGGSSGGARPQRGN
jgi:hypothetical protein